MDLCEQLLLSVWSGTAIFPHPPVYGWYLSTTGLCLYLSYSLHNVIAWIKNDPFLSRRASRFYIATVTLAQPFWVFHIYANFAYYNNINKLFLRTRPLEALFRYAGPLPWWLGAWKAEYETTVTRGGSTPAPTSSGMSRRGMTSLLSLSCTSVLVSLSC